MKKDQKQTAKIILNAMGGKENIFSITHCATRLRLSINDVSKINKDLLKDDNAISGYFEKNGQHQIILGTGYVNKVYNEIAKGNSIQGNLQENSNTQNISKFQYVTKSISDVFIPIIPVLLATGIIMGLNGLLINTFKLPISEQSKTILTVLTDTAYVFIPVLVTWSATKKFGGSPILGIVLGLMLVSPSLPNKWDVVNGLDEALKFNLLGIDINVSGYQSSVLPSLFLGWFLAKTEKFLHKKIPDLLDMLLVPFLTLLISLLLGLFLVGPILLKIEKILTEIILQLLTLPLGIGGIAYGGLIQILCAVGMHHTVTPIIVSIYTDTGLDYINPMGTAAIAGQLGAGLAVAFMQKDKMTRMKMLPALVPTLFGISETVMYGVTLPRLKPFLFGCIGGAVGGGFAAIVGLAAQGTGASMLPGMLLYLNNGLLKYIMVMVLSILSSYMLTYLFGKEDKNETA